MAKKNEEYWKDRFTKLEDRTNINAKAYIKDVQEQFRVAVNNIQIDIDRWYMRLAVNNEISYSAAKKLLKKNELDEFRWTVGQYIKKGKEDAVSQQWMKQLENASAKVHISRLESMKISIQQHAELLFTRYEGGVTDFIGKTYQNGYYHTAYEIAKGTNIGVNLHTIDQRKIDTILGQSWAADGADFSRRIWLNKHKLVNELHTELSQSLIRGDSPDKAIENLSKTMHVSRNQAGRLIMTESAAISSKAQHDVYKELGVKKYEIVATLDSITSDICQSMDGQVFDIKDYEVGVTTPPFHPNCRSCTAPYFDDEFTTNNKRAARDEEGKTYYVASDIKYPEWRESFVEGEEKDNLINIGEYGIIDNNKTNDKGADILIDKYTPCLIEHETGQIVQTELSRAGAKEIGELKQQGWNFDWKKALKDKYDIYKLSIIDDTQIQGLIALAIDRDMQGIYINIVETAPHNFGSDGKYEGVGAHLFAHACRIALNEGYDLVYFDAKSSLIEYYKKKLGAIQIGATQRMYIDGEAFNGLIDTYYGGSDIDGRKME